MFNDNRYNYEGKNINKLNYINKYQNRKRSISPQIINERNLNYYYSNEENPKKNNIYNQNQNYRNKINIIQQNMPQEYIPSYNIPNNYYPMPTSRNIYYEPFIPPNNQYIFTDNNYNYIPNIIPQNSKSNIISQNDYTNEDNNETNKNRIDKYKNGVNLNISNYETQYPMTFLSADPYKKRNIQNIFNNNDKINNNDIYTKTFQKNKKNKNFNISKINHMNMNMNSNINDLGGEVQNIPARNKSKKKYGNNSNKINKIKYNEEFNDNYSNNNIKSEKHYFLKDRNNEIYKNSYYNIYTNPKRAINYEDEQRPFNYKNNKINYNYRHNNEKNNNILKRKINVNENEKKNKYIYKIKKFIDHIEQYFIISFHNYFYFFLEKLAVYNKNEINKNKNSLLKRFQRIKNNNNIRYEKNDLYFSKNYSPNKYPINNDLNNDYINSMSIRNFKKLNKYNTYSNIFKNIYVPKKKLEHMENIELIEQNRNSLNPNSNYGHQKNRSLDYFPNIAKEYQNNSTYNHRLNLSLDFNQMNNFKYQRDSYKDNSVDKINKNYINNRNSYLNKNNSHDLLLNKLSPRANSYHRKINDNFNKKNIIYVKPKASKINLKRKVINKNNLINLNDINENNSNKNYTNSFNNTTTFKNNSNYIYNNIFNNNKNVNDNIVYNTHNDSIFIKNAEGFRSPMKTKFKAHSKHISDLPIEPNNNNLNDNKYKNLIYLNINDNNSDDNNDNNDNKNINEVIGNEDLIEETIIKDICTYDKKLWVFIKYIISPKAKQKFLKMKIKRLKSMKNSKNYYLNKELYSLKQIHTDSIELISPISKLNSYTKYNNFSYNKNMIIKEISEEKESVNNSNIQDDENLNNKLLNMVNILEDYKKRNYLYFYEYFFNILDFYTNENDDNKDNANVHKNIFKNILNNFNYPNISNSSNKKKKKIKNFSYENTKNTNKNIYDDNNIYNSNENSEDNKKHYKRNLFRYIQKTKLIKNKNDEDKYFLGNINIIRNKLYNLSINNDLSKKSNSSRDYLNKRKIYDEYKFDLLRKYILKFILKRKQNKNSVKGNNENEQKRTEENNIV